MNDKQLLRLKRHRRVRAKVQGTAARPRLNVFRSLKHIYAQLVDDDTGKTLVAASTVESAVAPNRQTGGNLEGAQVVGALIAERAKGAGISAVVFDRGGYAYHGRVQKLAESARAGGLEF